MSNPSLLLTKLPLSTLRVYVHDSNSLSSKLNIHSSSMTNPSSETRELHVYIRRKKQSQREIETLAHPTSVQESELDPMTPTTSTRGKIELKQKGSKEI